MPHRYAAVPADGVYAGYATVADTRRPAAIAIGAAPTFETQERAIEVHLIDYAGPDLHGETITVDLIDRIRDLRHFSTVDELVQAIGHDVQHIRAMLAAQQR